MVKKMDLIDMSKIDDFREAEIIGSIEYQDGIVMKLFIYSDFFNQDVEIKLSSLEMDRQLKLSEMVRDYEENK